MRPRNAANAYASIGVETGTMGATPHQLITMLFDGAHASLKKAAWAIDQNDVTGKGRAISKAIDIIELGLRASLDLEVGGELAENLDALYSYMVRTLLQANLATDVAKVNEVDHLLGNISSAWKQIDPDARPA